MILANWTDEELINALPHGGGIDCAWRIKRTKTRVLAYNSFHVMDDNGMYCGWQDFKVVIFAHKADKLNPLKGPSEGKVQVIHRAGDIDCKVQSMGGWRRDAAAYGLRDYLEDEIYHGLRESGVLTSRKFEILDD